MAHCVLTAIILAQKEQSLWYYCLPLEFGPKERKNRVSVSSKHI